MKLSGVFIALAAVLFSQGVVSHTISLTEESLEAAIKTEIAAWVASGLKTQSLDESSVASSASTLIKSIKSAANNVEEKKPVVCTLCTSIVGVVMNYIRAGMTQEGVINVITNLCTSLDLYPLDVCSGVVTLNAPIAFYIVQNKPTLEPKSICGLVLQSSSCEAPDEFEWEVEVDEGSPKITAPEETEETVKIVQITDLHYDPVYEPFGNALCDAPTCCRKGQNVTNVSGVLAGYWADYNSCDTPWHTFESAIEQIVTTESDITQVYFTGDVVDHGVWETTQELNVNSIIKTFAKLYETFGSVPVYSALGNHEAHPMNVFASPAITDEKVSTSWLYELVADIWIGYGWLPESTRSTILQGGYYTVSPKTGFRIIALNNNLCYIYNWWIAYEPQDSGGQLRWLAETLLQAEEDGEYVHILSHMPVGSGSCQYTWAREFRKIVNRFAHIITAEFNGHTHNDEIRVIYDLKNPTQATRVAWNGGGLIADGVNLNYKVYTADANTYLIEEVDNWIFNLTLANETPGKNPVWYKSYSFKEEYGLEDLSVESLNNLVLRMATDSTVLSTYYRHFVKQADPALSSGCDEDCRANLLCRIVTAVSNDQTQCDYFSNLE